MAFCTKCGSSLDAGASFCTGCGARLESASAPVAVASVARAAVSSAAGSTVTGTAAGPAAIIAAASANPRTTVSLGAAVVGLICFFLPWFQISCGGQVAAQVSGWQIASGMDAGGQHQAGDAWVFLVLVALLVVAALMLLLLIQHRPLPAAGNLVQAGGGGLAALVPLIEYANLSSKAQSQVGEMAGPGMIRIDTQFGLWATVIAGLVIALLGVMQFMKKGHPASASPTG